MAENRIPENNWLEQLQQQNQLSAVMKTNQISSRYGLTLKEEDAALIVSERVRTLREQRRVEFGKGILEKLIYEFCDSAYLEQDSYGETLIRLQEIFYLYKNEMLDEITDDELLHVMKEMFETICFGDLGYLESTCLDLFAQAIRAGYRGFQNLEGQGEANRFLPTKRWDYELYQEALKNL